MAEKSVQLVNLPDYPDTFGQKREHHSTPKNDRNECCEFSLKSLADLKRAFRSFLEELHSKRQNDIILLGTFKKKWIDQSETYFKLLGESFKAECERNNNNLQHKLSEFMEIVDRINVVEAELEEFHQAINTLFQDLKKY